MAVVISPPAARPPAGPPIVPQAPPEVPMPVMSDGLNTTAVSTTINGHTALPTVKFARPRIGGEVLIDRGEAAEFLVAHVYVGTHPQGSLVSKSDFPEGTDFDRLVRLEALIPLDKSPAEAASDAPPPSDPASDATADAGKKSKGK